MNRMMVENERLRKALRATAKASIAAEVGLIVGAALSQQAEPANVMQYYYRVNGCDAATSKSEDCICWHDQGTGPYPKAVLGDETFTGAALAWREKPEQPSSASAQDEREAFEAFQSQRPSHWRITNRAAWKAALKYAAENYRPAQIEQQPVEMGELRVRLENGHKQFVFEEYNAAYALPDGTHYLYAAPIAQTAPNSDCEWCAGAGKDHFGEKCEHCQAAPQPEQSGLVDTWAGVKAIPVSDAEYAAIYRNTCGFAPKSVKPGDGVTAMSGVSYVVSAALSAQGDKP